MEAKPEHAEAKKVISQLESTESTDKQYNATVSTLSDMINHHVKEDLMTEREKVNFFPFVST
jgi:hypothetical protein